MAGRRVMIGVLFLLCTSCKVGGCVANSLGDVVGETGDAYCDRRFVGEGGEPGSFCQEIIDTVALSQFQDDCREKHAARANEGKCPRERIIAGCKLHKENDDGSEVWDWYYDVSDLIAEAGAGQAGHAGPGGKPPFEDAVTTKEEVRKLCADPSRYEEGASYAEP